MKKLICGFTALLLGATGAVCHAQTGVPDFSWYGDGTASEFYIGTADQLAALCSLSNGFESGSEPIHFYGKTIHLTADIDLSCYGKNYNFRDGEGWYPIGDSGTTCFHAVFDGNGKTIKNLYMNRTSPSLENVGFFGFIGSGGVVKNLTFENVDISNTLPTNNYSVEMGTVAGYFKGNEITDCVVTGNIKGCNYTGGFTGSVCGGTISNCYFKGVIEAPSAGGISGLVQMGKIVNCFTDGEICGKPFARETGTCEAGGIATRMEGIEDADAGLIENCISIAKISCSRPLNRGSVCIAGIAVGGSSGTINNCMALNPSVRSNDNDENTFILRGRVIYYARSCQNLLAFDGIELNVTESKYENYNPKKDGESRTVEQLQTADGFLPQFTKAPWTYEEGKLPGLFGKPVDMPEHLKVQSSVETVESSVKVYVQNDVLFIDSVQSQHPVSVFDIMGHCVYQGVSAGTIQIALERKGVYIVRNGNSVTKILN